MSIVPLFREQCVLCVAHGTNEPDSVLLVNKSFASPLTYELVNFNVQTWIHSLFTDGISATVNLLRPCTLLELLSVIFSRFQLSRRETSRSMSKNEYDPAGRDFGVTDVLHLPAAKSKSRVDPLKLYKNVKCLRLPQKRLNHLQSLGL